MEAARAAGVGASIVRGDEPGLLVAFGCWSVGVPLGAGVFCSCGVRSGVPGVLPVVPMVDVDGCSVSCPATPVVEVVLLC